MKVSLFNVFLALDDGRKAVYNTATAGVVELPSALFRLLQKKPGSRLPRAVIQPAELRSELVRNKVLVPHDIDEIQQPIHQRLRARFASPIGSVLVLPTQECNLSCHYCSARVTKNKRLSPMSLETADRVVTFIGELLDRNRCTRGSIGFYGGEPLTNKEACARVIVGVHEFGEKHGIPMHFVVTTNGVLLTTLGDSPILDIANSFHITLDGDRNSHNEIRRNRDGDTYDRIMEGIALLVERDAGVVVRIHSNHLTAEGLASVLDDLENAGMAPGRKAAVFLGTYGSLRDVSGNPELCNKVVLRARRTETEHRVALYDACAGHRLAPLFTGVQVDIDRKAPKPLALGSGCEYDKVASATINCAGEIFSCPDIPGLAKPIGRIEESGRVRWEPEYHTRMADRWWPEGPCVRCKYVPVCGGGCLFDPRQSYSDCADLRRDFTQRITKFAEKKLREES